MKIIYIYFRYIGVIFLLSSCSVSAGKEPIISKNIITFYSGKNVTYSSKIIVKQDKSKIKPIYIEQNPIIVKSWKRLLLETKSKYIEDQISKITIYDFNGNVISTTDEFFGDAVLLHKSKRILILQQSAHHQVHESYVLDTNARKLAVIKHSPNILSFGQSEDDLTWWIITNGIETGRVFIEIHIYDYDGNKIDQFKKFTSSMINYKYKGIEYSVKSPEPTPPG